MADPSGGDAGQGGAKPKKPLQPVSGKLNLRSGSNTTLAAILNTAARALKAKKYPAFKAELAKAEAIAPDDARVQHLKGLFEFEHHNAIAAARLLGQALTQRPKDPFLQHNMAAVLISLGRFAEAEQLLLSAIALKPDYAEAYHTLSPIRTFTADDPLVPRMEAGLATPNLNLTDASFYGFALAKAQDDIGNAEAAWRALETGNAAMAPSFAYDPEEETRAVEALEQLVTRERLDALAPYGHQTRAPIFIVGMPRSGTTLLESILSAHPQVLAAGELTALGSVGRKMSARLKIAPARVGYAETIAAMPPDHQFAAALGYLNHAREKATGWFDHVVDKLPDNSFNLGLAAALLPNARVLHIMRHPLDVMLSIWFQRFTSVRYGFTPEHILHHWRSYQRAMAHWRQVLPMEIIELRYENLVQDKAFAQALLWERLELSLQVDHVPQAPGIEQQRTASRFQVKQPVYQSSREKFRHYEAHMGAFIDGLGGMEAIEAEVADQDARCVLRAAAGR